MYKSDHWLISCPSLKRIITELEKGKGGIPPIPVPVTLSLLGLCNDGRSMLFENMVQGQFFTSFGTETPDHRYYVINVDQHELVEPILRQANDDIFWVISTNNDSDIGSIKHSITNERVITAGVGALYIGTGVPDEAYLTWEF